MSDTEEGILVDRMDGAEAEQVKETENLLDFGDTPAVDRDESPISSTTDQLIDLSKPEQPVVDVGSSGMEAQDANVRTNDDGIQDIPLQDVAQTQPSTTENENKSMPEDIPEKKELTSCMAKWLIENNVDPRVIDLIYWRCWKRSATVFGGIMFLLLSLTCCTFMSVITIFSMALLTVAFLYRIGMTVFNAVQKTSAEHPFKHLLDEDLRLSEESVQNVAEKSRTFINAKVAKLQKLFLIEDAVESVKFGVMLWLLSYIGSWFSMLTLSIIMCIDMFTIPILYERNQEQVDNVLGVVKTKAKEVMATIQAKIPEKLQFGKAKTE